MLNPLMLKDFYKADHIRQYPKGTSEVYSNLTARYSRMPGVDSTVVFGIQYFIKLYLIEAFGAFFANKKEVCIDHYKRIMDASLGKDAVDVKHFEALHELGYLPLEIKALPEGTACPLRVPIMTIRNTHPDFYWLTNMIETLLSNALWHPMTTATIAHEYRKVLDRYAKETSDCPEFVDWQGHDFSMRGQSSLASSIASAAGHLLSFTGTDTIPAIPFLEEYYNADCTKELIGGSVPATEHSVMCMGGMETEEDTYRRLLGEVYPKGVVSIVSDTWDYWKLLTETLPKMKDLIMSREGKFVVRPDSGDPVKIICGDPSAAPHYPEAKGTAQVLWDIFGGKINSKGFKELDPHIGMIYGDSITLDRAQLICMLLKEQGFASTNIVFGIGSYTYQYVTRDTFGFAMKATHGIVNGEPRELFKSPKTDNGVKYSAKGYLMVDENLKLHEGVTKEAEETGMLKTVFLDGKLQVDTSLQTIRNKLKAS